MRIKQNFKNGFIETQVFSSERKDRTRYALDRTAYSGLKPDRALVKKCVLECIEVAAQNYTKRFATQSYTVKQGV